MPDVNLLVAMYWETHQRHSAALQWRKLNSPFATCPITELGMLRVLIQLGADPSDAFDALDELIKKHRQKLVPCDLSANVIRRQVKGHRQITDAYLLQLSKKHGLSFSTFDTGIKGDEIVR